MAIRVIRVRDFMAFHADKASEQYDLECEFCDGVNVIIGENGSGKTTLLKLIYAATQWSEKDYIPFNCYFLQNAIDMVLGRNHGEFEVFGTGNREICFQVLPQKHHSVTVSHQNGLDMSAVFIPASEMLSHSKGFLALNQKYDLPFDQTQIDIIVNASLPETRTVPDYMEQILSKISQVIDGEVVQENDTFYVRKKNGQKLDFSLEAEGLRKLGLLWKLIRNGLLEKDTVLLWDEPEANLNPELFPLVAEILLILADNGIQVFAATHSYNFAKYLEILRKDKSRVQFHYLKKNDGNSNENITCQSADTLEALHKNPIMTADEALLDRVYGMMENGQ